MKPASPPDFRLSFPLILTVLLLLNGCAHRFASIKTQSRQYTLHSDEPANKELDLFISPYRDSLEKLVDKILAISESELTIGRPGKDLFPTQVALGNFMTDAVLKIAREQAITLKKDQPDISFFTWGSFRKSLPKGVITLRNVFELMPFENEMVVLKVSGNHLKVLLKQISINYNPVSGATMIHNDDDSILVNGKPVLENEYYYVVASDYHAAGGDNLSVLLEASDSYSSGIKIRDAIVLYLQQLTNANQTLKPDYEPRIKN